MPPKQRRGTVTVEKVLAAALDLYAAKGHDGLTMSAVIAETGVSSGSLYHHFGNLEGLCAALYARCAAGLLDEVIAALESSRTARAGVTALVEAYLRFTRDEPIAARFLHDWSYADNMPGFANRVAEEKAPRMARIAGWFLAHIVSGEVIDLPDPFTELLVTGPVAETARRWLAGHPGIDLDVAARILPDRIWNSIAAPPG